jgi:hypothetical protein
MAEGEIINRTASQVNSGEAKGFGSGAFVMSEYQYVLQPVLAAQWRLSSFLGRCASCSWYIAGSNGAIYYPKAHFLQLQKGSF